MASSQKYANLYVRKKAELIPLMETAYGKPIPKNATHGWMISLYIYLLKNDPNFAASVEKMIAENFKNAADPVSAIAEGVGSLAEMIGGIVTGRQESKNIAAQAQANSDAALYSMVLTTQQKDNTGKIILFSGVALLVVGAIITVIIIKRKKK